MLKVGQRVIIKGCTSWRVCASCSKARTCNFANQECVVTQLSSNNSVVRLRNPTGETSWVVVRPDSIIKVGIPESHFKKMRAYGV